MPSLADLQGDFRRAISRDASSLPAGIVAPGDPLERLSIYRRHFRESFRRHLRGRFPTLEWLLGTARMIELADAFVQADPPRAPSLAEYGADLAAALSGELGAGLPPYLSAVAMVDWTLGNVAIATQGEPLAITALAALPADQLGEARLDLQPGLAYLSAHWPVDTLLNLRLRKSAPDRLEFEREMVSLELRGGRGNFSFKRLAAGAFAFRTSLQTGDTLNVAAEAGVAADPDFDIATALAEVFAEGLVTAIQPANPEPHDA